MTRVEKVTRKKRSEPFEALTPIDIDALNKLSDYAVKKGASDAEIFAISGRSTRFAIEKNHVNFASTRRGMGIGIRVLVDKRLGFSYATDADKAKDAVDKAIAVSRLGEKTSFTFPKEKKYPTVQKVYDRVIAEITTDEALDIVEEMIDSARAVSQKIVVTSGALGYGEDSFAIVNTNGINAQFLGTEIGAQLSTVLKDEETTTGTDYASSRLFKKKYIDVAKLGHTAAKLALDTQGAKRCETAKMTVILTPYVMSQFIEFLIGPALIGEAAKKGESPYSGRMGKKVASSSLSVFDDGTLENGLNSADMDDEGTPSQRTALIVKGTLKNFIYSAKDAHENNTKSTGNAMRAERFSSSRSYRAPPSVRPRNVILSSSGKTYSLDKMLREVDNGVLVYDAMGAHTSNPASCDFSVNSSTLFKIEKGQIVYPIRQAMLSGNMVDALANIELFGSDVKMMPGSLTPTCVVTPSIALGGIKVTG